jgi:hypothetical protein
MGGPAGLVLAAALAAHPARAAQDPLKIAHKDLLVTTTINVGTTMTATLTEFFTGDQSEKTGINMVLGLYMGSGDDRKLVATRDYNAATGGFVSRGSLQVIDLDLDGTCELLVEYHHKESPGSVKVDLDILRITPEGLVMAWTGPTRVDTTAPALKLPPAERDKFVREIDFNCTGDEKGAMICFHKTVSVASGAALNPPKVLDEKLPLAGRAGAGAAADK